MYNTIPGVAAILAERERAESHVSTDQIGYYHAWIEKRWKIVRQAVEQCAVTKAGFKFVDGYASTLAYDLRRMNDARAWNTLEAVASFWESLLSQIGQRQSRAAMGGRRLEQADNRRQR